MKRILAAALTTTALAATAVTGAEASDCGSVTIADMNWSSASLMANVDRFILEYGYGCEAELVPGDTMPTGTSMIEKNEPDIAPELWSNSMIDPLRAAEQEGRLKFAGQSLSDGGEEGFWIPKYLAEKMPELATIEGIKANASMFPHPEASDVGAFYGCPAGWNCQITSGHLFNALGLEEAGFEIVDPGSGAGLDGSIAKAYEREEAWFGYYWAPTAILGRYEMVKVDFGVPADEAYYISCISSPDCEDPRPTSYPPSPVHTVTTTAFADRSPAGYDYLTKRAFTNAQMNALLAWMSDERANGEIAAEHFLTTQPEIWTSWVSAEAAKNIKDELGM